MGSWTGQENKAQGAFGIGVECENHRLSRVHTHHMTTTLVLFNSGRGFSTHYSSHPTNKPSTSQAPFTSILFYLPTARFHGSKSCGNRSAYLGPARCAYRGQRRSRTWQSHRAVPQASPLMYTAREKDSKSCGNRSAYLSPARCAYRGQLRDRTWLGHHAIPKVSETSPGVVLTRGLFSQGGSTCEQQL